MGVAEVAGKSREWDKVRTGVQEQFSLSEYQRLVRNMVSKFEKIGCGEATCGCKVCIDFLFLNCLRCMVYFQSHLCIGIVSVCTGVWTCVCACTRTRVLVPAVIFSIVVFALHAYGILRLVASHLSPSHLTHLLPISECLRACSCVHLWSDTSQCTPTSLTAMRPRSYLRRFPLAAPACQCAVSGKIVG